MNCSSCLFFKQGYKENGNCKRRAPIAIDDMLQGVCAVWPSVSQNDYCGDYESRKTIEQMRDEDLVHDLDHPGRP